MKSKKAVLGWTTQQIAGVIVILAVLIALLFIIQSNTETATQIGTGFLDKLFG